MAEYSALKAVLPHGTLVAIRLGDFLEFFGEDAHRVAKLLCLTLTKRRDVPMAGIPFHAIASYTQKLIAAGCTVAIANESAKSLRILCPPVALIRTSPLRQVTRPASNAITITGSA